MPRSIFIIAVMLLTLVLSACETTTPHSQGQAFAPAPNIIAGRSVTVEQGETLYAFARRNKVSMRELIDLNHLQAPYQLAWGDKLRLPVNEADLPSVELGPIAYVNENDYKEKHGGKPVTTYRQVVPEPITETRAASLNDDTAYKPRLSAPKSELQTEASAQFKQPDPTSPASQLNLQPMHFDEKNKHLAEMPKPAPVVKPPAPTKPAPVKVAEAKKPAPIPAEVKAVVAEKAAEAKAVEAKAEPKKTGPEMHSRIEKKEDPANFIWPVQGTVVSTYGPKSNGLKNDGINIAVPRGSPVLAADRGTVAYAGSDIPGYGNVVLVRHPSGLMTTYAHLERMFVQKDTVVTRGDLLGTVGTTGGVDTPQLHFEIRRDKEALDPSKYLYH